ncbi:hypothetical protein ANO11243_084100 [Dothideomycetidae sp. 11243]|nr:hypothetical protein ANO11243_084100 [fungal sp. No.11243]
MSHSKRNTASALFTAHERSLLRGAWGSQSANLTRESLLPFGACRLCLLPSREPVSCSIGGHLFCRECALSNLLAQKKELRRLERESERDAEDARLRAAEAETQELENDQRAFEALQNGVPAAGAKKRSADVAGGDADWAAAKRARREGGDGRVSSSFWVPGELDATLERGAVRTRQKTSICPASEGAKTHAFSLKSLLEVRFHEPGGTRSCPACEKALSNATRAVLVRPCGHVLCRPCADKFLSPSLDEEGGPTCYTCAGPAGEVPDEKGDVKANKKKKKEGGGPGVVDISCEGTGFAGGGKNQVRKAGLAYQC